MQHACVVNGVGLFSRVNDHLQYLLVEEGGGLIFEGVLIFGRLRMTIEEV